MNNLSFKAKGVRKLSTGGAFLQKMQPGGVVQGPSHEAGGIPAVSEQGETIAEIEGGERIFSVEDTQAIEQASVAILQAAQQAPEQADAMAMELGYTVAGMVVKQEMANPAPVEGGQPPMGQPDLPPAGEISNTGDAYMEQPI